MTDRSNEAIELVHREAMYLDDQRWDDWLELYLPDCEYWAPTWRTEDDLTVDPKRQISHIYYGSRAGLEDRIVRIRSGKSPASSPMRRTAHLLGPIDLTSTERNDRVELSYSWVTHVFDPRHKEQFAFFGRSEVTVALGDRCRIARKKIVVKNDLFPAVVDVYCF